MSRCLLWLSHSSTANMETRKLGDICKVKRNKEGILSTRRKLYVGEPLICILNVSGFIFLTFFMCALHTQVNHYEFDLVVRP